MQRLASPREQHAHALQRRGRGTGGGEYAESDGKRGFDEELQHLPDAATPFEFGTSEDARQSGANSRVSSLVRRDRWWRHLLLLRNRLSLPRRNPLRIPKILISPLF